jgi:predicted GNAT family N-acyltransferase
VQVRLASGSREVAEAYAVRHEVFVTEQGVPADLELDSYDEDADHFVAFLDEVLARQVAVGAGRLVVEPAGFAGIDPSLGPVGHLGRLAVRRPGRGTGLGVALVRAIEARARSRGLRVMVLSAQTQAVGFYERLGYTPYGEVCDDAGLPHRWMRSPLD